MDANAGQVFYSDVFLKALTTTQKLLKPSWQPKVAEAKARNAYWSSEQVREHCTNNKKVLAHYPAKVVDEDSFNKHFRVNSKSNGKIREWVLVYDRKPKIDDVFQQMTMDFFIKYTCTLVKVQVANVYKFFDEVGQIIIFS